jgi:hypothetical protein
METKKADECEYKMLGKWIHIPLEDALAIDASEVKRCIECHGQLSAHHQGHNGMRAHFEHFEVNHGCSFGASFDGIKTPHRIILA